MNDVGDESYQGGLHRLAHDPVAGSLVRKPLSALREEAEGLALEAFVDADKTTPADSIEAALLAAEKRGAAKARAEMVAEVARLCGEMDGLGGPHANGWVAACADMQIALRRLGRGGR